MLRYGLLLVIVAAVGCAGHRGPAGDPTGVAEIEIVPLPPPEPPLEGYRPLKRIPERPPTTLEQARPDYPASALAFEIACTARLLYHIETDGSATLVRLEWDEPPPDEHRPQFEQAIEDAMASWQFVPAMRWDRPTKPGDSARGLPKSIPKAERALVRFRVENGKGVVN